MSSFQVTTHPLAIKFRNINFLNACASTPYGIQVHIHQFPASFLKVICSALKYQQTAPVCLFSGKGKSENDDKGSPWDALKKAMGNLNKKTSVEDVLREQIAKQDYYGDESGSGDNPPGGRGGDGGSGDGSGEPDGEGFSGIMEEVLQVTLATLGFAFLYIYIIEGEDITRVVKDLIVFTFTRKKSRRLKRLMDEWGMFFQSLTKKEEMDPYWLERAIITTPTAYDNPQKYRRMLGSYLASRSDY